MSISSDLSVLSDLHCQGELTAEEYSAAKQYVLKHGSLEVPSADSSASKGSGQRPPRQGMPQWRRKLNRYGLFVVIAFWGAVGAGIYLDADDAPAITPKNNTRSVFEPTKSDGTQIEVVYSRSISATEYGKDWPFPAFPNGLLRCEHMTKDGVTRRLVSVELAYRVHGLNGPAIGWAGYSDARELMPKHPEWGTFELGASDRMISEALANCG